MFLKKSKIAPIFESLPLIKKQAIFIVGMIICEADLNKPKKKQENHSNTLIKGLDINPKDCNKYLIDQKTISKTISQLIKLTEIQKDHLFLQIYILSTINGATTQKELHFIEDFLNQVNISLKDFFATLEKIRSLANHYLK